MSKLSRSPPKQNVSTRSESDIHILIAAEDVNTSNIVAKVTQRPKRSCPSKNTMTDNLSEHKKI